MSEPSTSLKLTVVAIHSESFAHGKALSTALSEVVRRVEIRIRQYFPSVALQHLVLPVSQAFDAIDATWTVIVVDVTEPDLGLSYFLGRGIEAAIPCFTMCEGDGAAGWKSLLERSTPHVSYASANDLHTAVMSLEQELVSAIPQFRIHDEFIYRFWFPRETASIRIVCPQIHDPGEFADRSSPDYTYLDNLGDTDALLELTLFLSQCYPRASIDQFSSEDLPDGHTSGNLVIIGGPGSPEISNEVCRQMMSMVNSSVAYSDDCEEMRIQQGGTSIKRRAQYGTRRSTQKATAHSGVKRSWFSRLKHLVRKPASTALERDWGYFARFPNPLNENATVVLVNGIHTAGVVGAARAFSDRRETSRNYQSVFQSGVDVARFECLFEVPVVNGESSVPEIDPANVLPLGPVSEAAATLPPRSSAERRESVRVLFIVGDRGGSQVNQIQAPNEYHSIQEALRSSRHREVIGMTNPILAATRKRLARAYFERPTVIHFAGHGNDRCLAIINDEYLTATTVPLDIAQLCEMIDTLEQRPRLCVLNACMSRALAQQVVDQGIADFAVGWSAKVEDSQAIAFATALYGAIGDGRTLNDSVSAGRVACGLSDDPVLLMSSGQSADIVLVDTGDIA